ncbi:TRAP transporter small permease subunit [uncultured Ruegeria sp.]|uniref:TRAP transporter small permease subunit n=1 Tax=uncultured Ruegeria sp. TaxID=259304 RepID=UPI002606F919|nr:TRAP transporter small permease [uncultured Ruegeria sp.]
MDNLISLLQRMNERLAIAAGLLLLGTALVTLFDIIARPLGMSLGGTDELSGYTMAIATSWGIGYALTSLAHVRIDLLRAQCNSRLQAWFDMIAILALAGVATVVAYRVWPVLAKTIQNKATANTTLETPLWIPQSLWLAGWFWFAFSAVIIAASVILFIATGKSDQVNEAAGMRGEA